MGYDIGLLETPRPMAHAYPESLPVEQKTLNPRPVPRVQDLTRIRASLDQWQTETLQRVGGLIEQQKEVTSGIATDLVVLHKEGDNLQTLERTDIERSGLLASLTRAFGRRSRMLERQSVANRLQAQYGVVHENLRRASVFADELRLCAVELAQEVDRLHTEVEDSLAAAVEAEARISEIEAELASLDVHADVTHHRTHDRLRFELADTRTAAALFDAKARLCAHEVEPARALRDTVQRLHQEMAHYVLAASTSVDSSGRRIQALGLAADAPLVISELQAGLEQLDAAMSATEAYLEQAHDLLTRVLPELSDHVRSHGVRAAHDLEVGLAAIGEVRQSRASDEQLKAAALAEVERLGIG